MLCFLVIWMYIVLDMYLILYWFSCLFWHSPCISVFRSWMDISWIFGEDLVALKFARLKSKIHKWLVRPAQHILLGGHPAMVNKTALIVSFLAVITLGGVTNKFAYQIKDVGDPAYPPHFFKKPWFLELLMFIGMTMSFPLHWALQSFSKPKVADGTQSEPLLPEEARLEGLQSCKEFHHVERCQNSECVHSTSITFAY